MKKAASLFIFLSMTPYTVGETPMVNIHVSEPVALSWTPLETNDSYAVQVIDSLSTGSWSYTPPIDQWPYTDTNFTGTASTAPLEVFRLQAVNRGRLESATFDFSLTTFELGLLFGAIGFPITPSNAVAVYDVVYETFDHRDQSTLASGSVIVPTGKTNAPLLSFQHGTSCKDSEAPSESTSTILAGGLAFASHGYAVALPDFPGLGNTSPGLHPYLHSRSEAISSVDFLRACKTFFPDRHQPHHYSWKQPVSCRLFPGGSCDHGPP